ncbi:biopolymer transporter ExbD [candidate division KSB1 bacterium]|nr:biopolymer transporter ExbD [candidate division KSB1 bacterium]
MNLQKTLGRTMRHRSSDAELTITPIMNCFLIMVPFLLLTASFVRLAMHDLSLPSLERKPATAQVSQSTPVVLNFLYIRETGFELRSPELTFPALPKRGTAFDWGSLATQLQRIRTRYPESDEIIIAPVNSINYQTIITVMDHCRENGFSNISISG